MEYRTCFVEFTFRFQLCRYFLSISRFLFHVYTFARLGSKQSSHYFCFQPLSFRVYCYKIAFHIEFRIIFVLTAFYLTFMAIISALYFFAFCALPCFPATLTFANLGNIKFSYRTSLVYSFY